VRKDHRPYAVKKAYLRFQKWYTSHFIRPQLDRLGRGFHFIKPWNVELFGPSIELGNYVTVIAAHDRKVRLCVWPVRENEGCIRIGDCCLICPGVRISAAYDITINADCMIASGAYITDSDWHGLYDRVSLGEPSPVRIGENVWIGDGAVVCKGVTIGKNSVVGASSVVTRDIPENAVAAGNPAEIVKRLDPDREFVKRSAWFSNPDELNREIDGIDRDKLRGNTIWGWIRNLLLPKPGD